MSSTKKVRYMVSNGTDYDLYAFETTADQIKEGVLTTQSQLNKGTDTQLVSAKLIKEALALKANQSDISNGLDFKGSCLYNELPMSNNTKGDFYYTTDNQHYYTWNGSEWIDTGIGVGDVVSKEEFNEEINELKGDIVTLKGDNTLTEISTNILDGYITTSGTISSSTTYNRKRFACNGNPFILFCKDNNRLRASFCRFLSSDGSTVNSYGQLRNLGVTKVFPIANSSDGGNGIYVIFPSSDDCYFEINSHMDNYDFTNSLGFNFDLVGTVNSLCNGYTIQNDEWHKCYITNKSNNIENYFSNGFLDTSGVVSINSSSRYCAVLLRKDKTYYIGYPTIQTVSDGAMAFLTDTEYTRLINTSMEDGYTVNINNTTVPTKKYTPTKDGILLVNVKVGDSDWYNTTVVTTLPTHDNFIIENKIVDINGIEISNTSSVLKGQKICVFGDSITEVTRKSKKNWHKYLADNCGCTIQNLGASGTGFAKNSPYINRISNLDSDVTMIGVAGSFNDLSADLPIGTSNDTGTSTLGGYINDFFDTLLINYPSTPIVCYIQNPWGAYHYGKTESDNYVNVLSEICKKKGIPFNGEMYLNGSVLRPWNEDNRLIYFLPDGVGGESTTDSTHPNSKGHLVIYRHLLHTFEENVFADGLTVN